MRFATILCRYASYLCIKFNHKKSETMRKLIVLLFAAVLVSSFGETQDYEYLPILMKKTDLRQSIQFKAAQPMVNPGKIYINGKYLFITEKYKGVHIVNNSNPQNPVIERFIQVPGCMDIAAKGSIIYLDNAIDLVAIDISDLDNMRITKRIQDAFPEPTSPTGNMAWQFSDWNRPEGTVIVEWVKND